MSKDSNQPKSGFSEKIISLTKNNRQIVVILSSIVILSIIVLAVLMLTNNDEVHESVSETPNIAEPTAQKTVTYSLPLNGELVTDEGRLNAPVNAFVVSNSPEARPQSGLVEADIVYELMVEGNATRYLSLYQGDSPEKIGPLRSLRVDFSDIALTYDAPIAHVGGDPDALAEIPVLGVKDYDEFALGGYFYRASDRLAPHNLYTSNKLINQLNKDKGYTKSSFISWPRQGESELDFSGDLATTVAIKLDKADYQSSYLYNKSTNSYDRSVNNQPHKDREANRAISPSSILVIKATHRVSDSAGHLDIGLVGEGSGKLIQLGKQIEINWSKKSRSDPFVITNIGGDKVEFVNGQTWVHILPLNTPVEIF